MTQDEFNVAVVDLLRRIAVSLPPDQSHERNDLHRDIGNLETAVYNMSAWTTGQAREP